MPSPLPASPMNPSAGGGKLAAAASGAPAAGKPAQAGAGAPIGAGGMPGDESGAAVPPMQFSVITRLGKKYFAHCKGLLALYVISYLLAQTVLPVGIALNAKHLTD